MATLFNTKIKDTYQSLLKLEDNTILTTTSKNITDGLGNASPLYLSTTQVRIGSNSASAMYWDDVNSRLGIGTNSPVYNLHVNSTGTNILTISSTSSNNNSTELRFVTNSGTWSSQIRNWQSSGGANQGLYIQSGGIFTGGSINAVFNISGNTFFGNTLTPATARVHIQGSGSTSATTSLLVQNSAQNSFLTVYDNGAVNIGSTNPGIYTTFGYSGRIGNNIFESPSQIFRYGSGQLTFYGTNNNANAFSFEHNNQQASTSTGISMINLGGGYQNQVGFQFSNLQIAPTYDFNANTTTAAIARGIYYNPTITNLRVAQHRAIETVTGDVLFGTTSGNVGIGTSSPDKLLTVGSPNYGGWFNGEPTIKFNKDLGVLGSLSIAGDSSILYLWRSGSPGNGSTISSNYDGSGGSLRLGVTSRTDVNIMQNNGDVTIGNNITTLGAKLGIKGNGSTNATTSLLVQNSAGTNLLQVRDNGESYVNGNLSITNSGFSGNLFFQCIGNYQQQIRGAYGESIYFGRGGNTLELYATEVYVSSNFYGPAHGLTAGGLLLGAVSTPVASAQLELRSTTKGFLPPRVTTIQKNAISSPAEGLFVYDTDLKRPCFFNGTSWITL